MHDADDLSVLIFLASLTGTFAVSFLGHADGTILNEAASGILVGLGANFLAANAQRRAGTAIAG